MQSPDPSKYFRIPEIKPRQRKPLPTQMSLVIGGEEISPTKRERASAKRAKRQKHNGL